MAEADIKHKLMASVSVVIPVKNEALKIKACIDGILSQTVKVDEIIVIDSGSTDGTIDILKSYEKVKLIEISGKDFNHGMTRNLGVSHVTSEYVVLTVGDARAYNDCWIEGMLAGFTDNEVAAVCGKQVVPPDGDKNPVDWYRPVGTGNITRYQYSDGAFDALSADEKKTVCGWDDVTAMYRTNVLKELPFRKTSYSEDALWAMDALKAGYAIAYSPEAMVYHYHFENPEYTYKRTFTVLYHMYKFFGYTPKMYTPTLVEKLKLIKLLMSENRLSLAEKYKWLIYNFEVRKNLSVAMKDFLAAARKGEKVLDTEHEKLCGMPPIPPVA